MEHVGVVIAGAAVGGLIGATRKKKGTALKGVLLGAAGGLVGALAFKAYKSSSFKVGADLAPPLSLPTPALPGQMDYTLDPRTDPRLDPVSREHLYPSWLLAHWQRGDRKVIGDVQHALGIPADGRLGHQTSSAIQSVQAQRGLPATGVMDYTTMQALILG